jgi:hypothetical protein
MIDDACSRREFLKKFATLSGGALMLSATSIACSGLPKTALPSLIGIFFYDGDMQRVELRDNQAVPVHTQFDFVFSTDMNTDLHLTSYRTGVTFVDSNNNPIDFSIGWVNVRTLHLTPSADLSFNTNYIFTVYKAEDKIGNPLNEYADASAAFRTASI